MDIFVEYSYKEIVEHFNIDLDLPQDVLEEVTGINYTKGKAFKIKNKM